MLRNSVFLQLSTLKKRHHSTFLRKFHCLVKIIVLHEKNITNKSEIYNNVFQKKLLRFEPL